MSKQDRQGVRTAAELERKYNFSSMKKAIEMNEVGISKTNNTLDEFVNATMRNFLEMRSELDDKAEIWFYDGVPTLENEPASTWEDYSLHLGDMYYDAKTGYGYRLKVDGDVYSWEQITDQDTIYALALANSAKDTADNNRSLFVDKTPTPPYSIGDLWLKENTLYVCQVAKAEGEEYETADFILASKYADGMISLETDASLKRDYSTTTEMNAAIKATAEEISVELNGSISENTDKISGLTETVLNQNTEITATCESIILEATKDLVETGDFESFQQTVSSQLAVLNNEITMKFTATAEELQTINGQLTTKLSQYEKHISFSENGIGIHDANGEQVMELWLDSGLIKFIRGGQQFGHWDGEDFYTSNIVVEVTKRVQLGPYAFVPRANGHMSLLKVE